MSTKPTVPLVDLGAQHSGLRSELVEAASHVIESTQFILGEYVESFEQEFAALHGKGLEGVAVNSGTSALHLALLALDIGEGDEVITTPYTFLATAEAIRYSGARPVFVDIDPDTHTLDSARVEAAITPRTKALLPVHIFGQPAEMNEFNEVAQRHGLAVIEDAAQAHLAVYDGRKAGAIGDIGCFSFYPSKNLGACGEGGLALTRRPEYATRLRMLRDWGQRAKNGHEIPGFNARMDGMQAAMLRVKLKRLPAWTELRREHARAYGNLIEPQPGVSLPREISGREHAYHIYALQLEERDAARRRLQEAGIGTGIHYPTPVHLLPWWREKGHREGDFPIAEALANNELSLPMYAELTREQIGSVASAVNALARQRQDSV